MKSIMRRALGLESAVDIAIASGEEVSDVAGMDVQELFGEVDAYDHHAPNTAEGDNGQADAIYADMEFVQSVVDVLQAAGDEGASPTALAVAQEGMQAVFSRYGIGARGFAQEAASLGQAHATKQAIAYANESMAKIATEGIGESMVNVVNRMKANMQQFFRRRTTWRNEAIKLQKELSSANGQPKQGAAYSNRIRIAHMTTGDHTVLKDGKALLSSTRDVNSTMTAVVAFLTGLTSLYSWFNKEKGKVDFDKIAALLPESKYSPGMLSITGPQALFGEETVMSSFGGVSDNPEEMMAIMRQIAVKHVWVWRVKDLDITPLEPMTIDHMKSTIGDFVKIGDEILALYNRYDREMSRFTREQIRQHQQDGQIINMVTSPIRYFRFQRIYVRLLNQMIDAMATTLDLNFMAATSLLDYYRWSLENNR